MMVLQRLFNNLATSKLKIPKLSSNFVSDYFLFFKINRGFILNNVCSLNILSSCKKWSNEN